MPQFLRLLPDSHGSSPGEGVQVIVTREAAGIGSPGIGDGGRSIGGDDVDVKIDEPLTGDGAAGASHAVGSVAGRAREAVIEMASMFGEAGICHDLSEAMALSA